MEKSPESKKTLEQKLYKTLVEASPDPIMVHDLDGRFKYYNKAAADILGIANEEANLSVFEIVPKSELMRINERRKKRETGKKGTYTYETFVKTSDGQLIPVLIKSKIIPCPDGSQNILLNIRDITDLKKIENQLQVSNERLKKFMENATEGFLLLDKTLIIQEANKSWCNKVNRKITEVRGKHITEILPKIKETGKIKLYKNVAETGNTQNFSHIIDSNGEEKCYNVEIFKVAENIGVISVDVTTQKEYEIKLEALHDNAALLAKVKTVSQVAEIITNTITNIIGFNRGSLGFVENDKLVHRYIWGVGPTEPFTMPLDGPGITVKVINTGETIKIDNITESELYVDGAPQEITQSELAVPIKISTGTIGVINIESVKKNAFSLTDKKLLELLAQHVGSAVSRINEEKRRRELLSQMKRLNTELEKSNNELENYTYVVSHDLKAPLRSIQSFSSFVLEDYGEKIDDMGKDYLQRISGAVTRMDALIGDLLTVSRVGRKFMEKEVVDLNEMLEGVKSDLSATIESKNVNLIIKSLPVVKTQKVWMNQLFTNLISNGLKFNESKNPTITITCEKEEEESYLFTVKDNGIGIPQQYQEKIFNLFERLHTVEEYPGTGAGLAICQKIVSNWGGKLWVESEKNNGSTFYFTFPIKT